MKSLWIKTDQTENIKLKRDNLLLSLRVADLETALKDIRKDVYIALTLDNITPKVAEDIFATITAEIGKK